MRRGRLLTLNPNQVEGDAAFFRRVLPAVARATSWRNAACNAAQREAYATVGLLTTHTHHLSLP